MAKGSRVLAASLVLVFVIIQSQALPPNRASAFESSKHSNETNLASESEVIPDESNNLPELRHYPDYDSEDEEMFDEDYVELESPYMVVEGQWWVQNVWQWLLVSPQHVVYVAEPHLPWYGNLIKWLRINVLFKPVY